MAGKDTAADKAAKEAADARGAARKARHDELEAQLDLEEVLAAVPQKVVDGNEAAALETITGQKPIRDTSDAPSPNELGPHEESENPAPGGDSMKATDPKGDG